MKFREVRELCCFIAECAEEVRREAQERACLKQATARFLKLVRRANTVERASHARVARA